MTRGNHELRDFYRMIREQVLTFYDEEIWQLVIDILNEIPIGIILDERIFVVHGGIVRPDLQIEEIRHIQRGIDMEETSTVEEKLMVSLLWAETSEENGIIVDEKRGHVFGPDITDKFLQNNNLELIVRAHSYHKLGSYESHEGRVITIHSAPDFNEEEIHYGAFMNVNSADREMHIKRFQAVRRPIAIDWQKL